MDGPTIHNSKHKQKHEDLWSQKILLLTKCDQLLKIICEIIGIFKVNQIIYECIHIIKGSKYIWDNFWKSSFTLFPSSFHNFFQS